MGIKRQIRYTSGKVMLMLVCVPCNLFEDFFQLFIPLQDDNDLVSIEFQFVTVGLIALNILAFFLTRGPVNEELSLSFAIIPSELMQVGFWGGPAFGPHNQIPVAEQYTLISYMFLHGDIWHLFGNMLFLWVFGDNVEDAMGHVKFLLFYLACGVAGGLVHSWVSPESLAPLIGASGAVAGVIAAYLLLHPRVNVWVLFLKFLPLRIPASVVLGLWVVIQVVMIFVPSIGPVAWWAHIGGLIAGVVLVVFLRRPGVPLFDGGINLSR